jgi:serine/threonine protein kinase
VLGELLLGAPLFPGESSVDQLVEIIKVLGTPSPSDVLSMNRNNTSFQFPEIKPSPWEKVFKKNADPLVCDLIAGLLRYDPVKRLTPLQALSHPFFAALPFRDTVGVMDDPPSGAILAYVMQAKAELNAAKLAAAAATGVMASTAASLTTGGITLQQLQQQQQPAPAAQAST